MEKKQLEVVMKFQKEENLQHPHKMQDPEGPSASDTMVVMIVNLKKMKIETESPQEF